MGQQDNPYSAPKARVEAVAADRGAALWRDGKVLVCHREADFPGRCIKCNDAVAFEKARFKLRWHHSGWYVLVLVNIVIYAVVAAAVSKQATLWVGLCAVHQRRRLLARVIGWGGFAIILAAIFVGVSGNMGWLAGTAGVALLPWAVATFWLAPRITAVRIDKEVLRVRGCGRDFLDSLPEYAE